MIAAMRAEAALQNIPARQRPSKIQTYRARFFRPKRITLAALAIVICVRAVVLIVSPGDASISSPAHWDARVVDIVHFVEQERGLTFDHPVAVEFLSEDDYVGLFDSADAEPDAGAASSSAQESGLYDAMGLAVGFDASEGEATVGAVTTLGFYSPVAHVVIVRGDQLTPAVRTVLAHELTHALQDQHFDLSLGGPGDLALRAIVEADAMRVEDQYTATLPEEDRVQVSADNSLSVESEAQLADVPAALVDHEYAPYVLGPMLISTVYAQQGNAGVDALLRRPPSEEVLVNPWMYTFGQVDATPTMSAPEGATVIEPSQPASMLAVLAMLDAWLPWSQARGALDGWAGGGYISYQRAEGTVCAAFDVVVDGSPDALVAAVSAWSVAAQSTAIPVVVASDVHFETCARPSGAQNPPPAAISLNEEIFLEDLAVESAPAVASAIDAAPYQCLARILIDDPVVGPLLLAPTLTPDQEAQFEATRLNAATWCGIH